MAASFQVRIEDIIGATSSVGSDDTAANQQAIQDALQDTASDILNKVRPDILIQYATKSSNVTSNPLASNVENSRILLVERREDEECWDVALHYGIDPVGVIEDVACECTMKEDKSE